MDIILLHPSRGRAKKARETIDFWIERASGQHEITHILSVDSDDLQLELYKKYSPACNGFLTSALIENPNKSVVEATNAAARYAPEGHLMIYLSDDFQCPVNWDVLVRDQAIEADRQIGERFLIKVDDCLQKFNVDVLTIPIMSYRLYQKLGYFWHPEYKSMFVDQDLFWTCKNNNWLFLSPDLKFPHLHYSNGKAPMDETYRISSVHWDSGKELYHKHKSQGFPLLNK